MIMIIKYAKIPSHIRKSLEKTRYASHFYLTISHTQIKKLYDTNVPAERDLEKKVIALHLMNCVLKNDS